LKKGVTIFFLLIYLLSVTEAHQLLKIPVVFEHFAEHKKDDKSISFFGFLQMHYMQGSKKDKDYERDMQLPFKTSANCIAAIANDYIPLFTTCLLIKSAGIFKKKIFANGDQFILSAYLSSIWQPPKIG
jgi:hypothetical protein